MRMFTPKYGKKTHANIRNETLSQCIFSTWIHFKMYN